MKNLDSGKETMGKLTDDALYSNLEKTSKS
jgi:hypothetical protein